MRRRSAMLGLAVSMVVGVAGPAGAQSSVPLSTAAPYIEEFSKKLVDPSVSEAERLQIIGLLALWQNDQARDPLVVVLDDRSDALRTASARALGWKGNTGAVPALTKRVSAPDEKAPIKVAALEALGKIGDESARSAVISATKNPDPAVRGSALWALTFEGLSKPTDRIEYIRQMAADPAVDPFIRCQAIQVIGSSRDTASIDLLMRVLAQTPTTVIPNLSNAPTEREIVGLRYRQARDVKAWAVKSLWAMEVRGAIPLFIKAAEEPEDFFLRLVALESLGSWRVHEALPVFLRSLDDPFEQTRITALWSLADLGDTSVLPQVKARLDDRVSAVRAQAVETYGELAGAKGRAELEDMQRRDQDARVQDVLERVLARLPK